METILDALAWIIPVLIAVILHEIAHGWMAERFGDDTARSKGRITFNPLKHIDPRGTIALPAMLWLMHSPITFGSAKPVPVDFNRLQPSRLGMFMVAIAGVLMNLALALLTGLLLHIEAWVTPEQAPHLFETLYRFLMLNCVLATFNLIPILPLDGGRVVTSLLPAKIRYYYAKSERIGLVLLIALLVVPAMLGHDEILQTIAKPPMLLVELVLNITGNGSDAA